MEEFNIIPNGKRIFLKQCLKENDKQNGICYHGGNDIIQDFSYLGKGDEGDKILKCYTFDLFTLSINIH